MKLDLRADGSLNWHSRERRRRVLGLALLLAGAAAARAADTNAVPASTNAVPVSTNSVSAATNTVSSATNAVAASTNTVATSTNKVEAPPPLTPEQLFEGGATTYNNWLTLSGGGFLTKGNHAQAQQNGHLGDGAFGGIEDFHLQQDVAKNTTLTINGRAIADQHDYKFGVDLTKSDLGFLRFNYQEFRTWYNGDGGFYPPSGAWYPRPGEALGLDRGSISFAAGLTLKDLPQITFEYRHEFRDGEESSTSWGYTHPDQTALVRGLSPTIYGIDEQRDIFSLEATHHIKATDLGAGVRYEMGELDNTRYITQWPGEPVQTQITDKQSVSDSTFSTHAFSETRLSKTLTLSSGFQFANLDNLLSGSRIYGNDFGVGYVPNGLNGLGYYNLDGVLHEQDYTMNLNLLYTPIKDLVLIPALRVQKQDWDATSGALGTLGDQPPAFGPSDSVGQALDVQERLEARYTHITNWVFTARGEWTEGDGNLNEDGGIGIIPPVQQQRDDHRFFQKYSLGARWYPARRVTVDFGGYYKYNRYDYSRSVDSTPNDPSSANRYPGYLNMQGFQTFDGNMRVSLRPLQTVTLVSRYEYQYSTIDMEPDGVSDLSRIESSVMNSHILAEDISWTPWSRLYLSAGFNYVISETKTPASGDTQAIMNAQNNYWTFNFNSGIVLDQKSDLNLGYFFYQSDNYYANNSFYGLPLGAGATEHGVSALLTRRLSKNLKVSLRYAYVHYSDMPSGGHENYQAHTLFSSLQYRF